MGKKHISTAKKGKKDMIANWANQGKLTGSTKERKTMHGKKNGMASRNQDSTQQISKDEQMLTKCTADARKTSAPAPYQQRDKKSLLANCYWNTAYHKVNSC